MLLVHYISGNKVLTLPGNQVLRQEVIMDQLKISTGRKMEGLS